MRKLANRSFQIKMTLLTISIGIIYFYFGMLKFFPNMSPAEQIGSVTVHKICFGLLPLKVCLCALAAMEVVIGLCLMSRKFLKPIIVLTFFHMAMTFSPMVFFPDLVFQDSFISPSLLGQYIYKNIVIICALLVIYPVDQKEMLPLKN